MNCPQILWITTDENSLLSTLVAAGCFCDIMQTITHHGGIALNKILVGSIFVSLVHFNITVNGRSVDILYVIGFLLIYLGLSQIVDMSKRLKDAKDLALVMIILHTVDAVIVMSATAVPAAVGSVGTLIMSVFFLLVPYCIIKGVEEVEINNALDLGSEQLYKAWILVVFFRIVLYVPVVAGLLFSPNMQWLLRMAGILLVVGIVSMFISIYYIYRLYKTRKLFNRFLESAPGDRAPENDTSYEATDEDKTT